MFMYHEIIFKVVFCLLIYKPILIWHVVKKVRDKIDLAYTNRTVLCLTCKPNNSQVLITFYVTLNSII